MAQTFDVSLDRLGAVSKELSEALKSQRATEKEIRQTLLLLEEITVKFSMCMPDAPVTAEISRRYGTLRVRLSAVGEEGHGGGDDQLTADFVRFIATGEQSISCTAIENSVAGHLTVFHADQSRENGGMPVACDFSAF